MTYRIDANGPDRAKYRIINPEGEQVGMAHNEAMAQQLLKVLKSRDDKEAAIGMEH